MKKIYQFKYKLYFSYIKEKINKYCNMPNKFLNKWGLAFLRLVGIVAFCYRVFKKWEYDWYIELSILAFFVILALYPSKMKSVFDKVFGKVKDKVTKNLKKDTGGTTPKNDDEESDA